MKIIIRGGPLDLWQISVAPHKLGGAEIWSISQTPRYSLALGLLWLQLFDDPYVAISSPSILVFSIMRHNKALKCVRGIIIKLLHLQRFTRLTYRIQCQPLLINCDWLYNDIGQQGKSSILRGAFARMNMAGQRGLELRQGFQNNLSGQCYPCAPILISHGGEWFCACSIWSDREFTT